MVRIRTCKPRIRFMPGSNDMSHYYPSEFVVAGYDLYITDDQYVKFLTFTDPSLMKTTKEECGIPASCIDDILKSAYAARIKNAISLNPQNSQLWQFDGLAADFETRIRSVVCLGVREFVLFRWYYRLLVPIYDAIVWLLNKSIYLKQERERKQWDKFLEELHEKRERKDNA
jgi:hypothetical protein